MENNGPDGTNPVIVPVEETEQSEALKEKTFSELLISRFGLNPELANNEVAQKKIKFNLAGYHGAGTPPEVSAYHSSLGEGEFPAYDAEYFKLVGIESVETLENGMGIKVTETPKSNSYDRQFGVSEQITRDSETGYDYSKNPDEKVEVVSQQSEIIRLMDDPEDSTKKWVVEESITDEGFKFVDGMEKSRTSRWIYPLDENGNPVNKNLQVAIDETGLSEPKVGKRSYPYGVVLSQQLIDKLFEPAK